MHLAERGGRRGLMLEALELALPVGAELGLHAALDEGPAHRRRLALQLGELLDVFRRQRLGDGGEQLRHLHDRALQPAERRGEFRRVPGAVEIDPEEARAGDPRRHAADIGADPGVAPGAGGEAVFFGVGHELALMNVIPRSKYAFPGGTPDVDCPICRHDLLRAAAQRRGSARGWGAIGGGRDQARSIWRATPRSSLKAGKRPDYSKPPASELLGRIFDTPVLVALPEPQAGDVSWLVRMG